jgi:hypothetical protein
MMRDEQGELIPGLPWQEQDSTGKKKNLFLQQILT